MLQKIWHDVDFASSTSEGRDDGERLEGMQALGCPFGGERPAAGIYDARTKGDRDMNSIWAGHYIYKSLEDVDPISSRK